MIPKIIHYVWFGGNELGEKEKKCLESWKKILPDYKIMRWDDSKISEFKNEYFEQAYKNKQYAFASDYARLKALYEYGGIYMDTDEEVLRPLDKFLEHDFFMGCQSCGSAHTLSPALIGTTPKNKIIKDLLSVYDETKFINPDRSFNRTTNPEYFVKVLTEKYNLEKTYIREGQIEFYPNSYIYNCFYFAKEGKDSYAIHHYTGHWKPDWKIENKLKLKLFGQEYIIRKYKKNRSTAILTPQKDEKILIKLKTSKKSSWTLVKKSA